MVATLILASTVLNAKVPVRFDRPVPVGLASRPVTYLGDKVHIVSLGEATFARDPFRLIQVPAPETPPGLYGLRWNNMPPVAAFQPAPFKFESGPFLRATVKANVMQYSDVEYRVSCAIFDRKGRLLGAGSHVETVAYVRLGNMPTLFREIVFDFGASKAFSDAAYATFAISDPEVPRPADAG